MNAPPSSPEARLNWSRALLRGSLWLWLQQVADMGLVVVFTWIILHTNFTNTVKRMHVVDFDSILPGQGVAIATAQGWPPGFTEEDLYRPEINIPLGACYLAEQRDRFGEDLFTTLAAYNGGPGNAPVWKDLANGNPVVFVEVIRFEETRNYVRQMQENFLLYRKIYDRTP